MLHCIVINFVFFLLLIGRLDGPIHHPPWKQALYHMTLQDPPTVSGVTCLPLDSSFHHVTCFGQWNVSRYDLSTVGPILLHSTITYEHKPGRGPRRKQTYGPDLDIIHSLEANPERRPSLSQLIPSWSRPMSKKNNCVKLLNLRVFLYAALW